MPSIVENRPSPSPPAGTTSSPFAAVILRVPDLNHQASPAPGSSSARVWKFRGRLPSAGSFLKGLTSRVLLVAIAMSAIAIFYMALNGTSPATKTAAPNNNIPLISSLPNALKKPASATVLIPETKSSNNGLFQDLPQSSLPSLPANIQSNTPASVSSGLPKNPNPPTSNVQPIRSVPAANQGPVLLGPAGDQSAMRSATLGEAAHREVFSWQQAEFKGGIDKASLATPSVPARGNLK